ncbi:MAG: hypothetical protein WCV55_03495 [Candidatus Paceibacterota bacterium]
MAVNSQDFVPIKEIREGVVVMKDGSLRSVIMTSSVNFALKGADEQEAIIMQFQNFLNSINFSIQIFMESRRLDIRPYITLLESVLKDQRNDLLRIQTREYINFIKTFTDQVNIMNKSFFVVVSYEPSMVQGKAGVVAGYFSGKKQSKNTQDKDNFEENRTQLEERMQVVIQGLTRMGVRSIPLGTEEVIELYYKLFNPGETEKPININEVTK